MKKYDNILALANALRQVGSWKDLAENKELYRAAESLWEVARPGEDFNETVGINQVRTEANRLSTDAKANQRYQEIVTTESEEGVKTESLDPVLREKLLEDLERQEKLKAEEWAKKIESQKSGNQNPGKDEVARVIRRKQELQAEIEAKLKQEKPNLDKRSQERIADGISDRLIVEEAGLEAKFGKEKAEIITGVIADKAVEGIRGKADIGKTETEVIKELSSQEIAGLKSPDTREIITDIVAEAVAEGTTREKIETEAEKLSSKVEKELGATLNQKSREELRGLFEEKIERAIRETGTEVGMGVVAVDESGESRAVEVTQEIKRITQAESVPIAVDIEIKNSSREVVSWLDKERPEIIDSFRGTELQKEVELTLLNDKNNSYQDIRSYAQIVREVRFGEGSGSPTRAEVRAMANLENSVGKNGEKFSPYQIKKGVEEAEVITNLLRGKESIQVQVGRYTQIRNRLVKIPLQNEGVAAVDRVVAMLGQDRKLADSLQFIKNVVHFKDVVLNRITGQTMSTVTGPMFMGQSMELFVTNSASQFAAFGLKQGLKNIIGGIFSGGVKAAAAGATEAGLSTAAGGAAAAAGAATGPPGWVVAAIVFGGKLLLDLGKKLWGKLKQGLESIFGESGARMLESLNFTSGLKKGIRELLPGALGWVGEKLVDLASLPFMLIAALSATSIASLVAIVIPAILIGMVVYELFIIAPVLVSITPPPIGKQVCQWVKDENTSPPPDGNINCNQGIEDQSVAGLVSKETFADLANRWTGGKNYAMECFNDVVSRSRCMGVNPAFALWVWLHESGASNYSIRSDIEDFGIHGQPSAPPRDFNAQINYFLKLSHQNACSNLPFWLGWATKYLTGDCDPDKEMRPGNPNTTGRAFLGQLQSQIGLISTLGMPNVIKTGGGGENCDFGEQTNSNLVNDVGETKPGYVWVCESNPNAPADTSGPGAPFADATPIYNEDCASSPACALAEFMRANGLNIVTQATLQQAIALINSWNAPAGFDKNYFISMMSASVGYYNYFQCVGFAVGMEARMGQPPGWGGSHAGWTNMIKNGNGACVPIDPNNAGAGDIIVYHIPGVDGGWYHIQYISVLRQDGSYVITDANSNARYNGNTQVQGGLVRNLPGTGGIANYMSSKDPLRNVLRCK